MCEEDKRHDYVGWCAVAHIDTSAGDGPIKTLPQCKICSICGHVPYPYTQRCKDICPECGGEHECKCQGEE